MSPIARGRGTVMEEGRRSRGCLRVPTRKRSTRLGRCQSIITPFRRTLNLPAICHARTPCTASQCCGGDSPIVHLGVHQPEKLDSIQTTHFVPTLHAPSPPKSHCSPFVYCTLIHQYPAAGPDTPSSTRKRVVRSNVAIWAQCKGKR